MSKRSKLYSAGIAVVIAANMSMTVFAEVSAPGVTAVTESAVQPGPGVGNMESTGINESTEAESGVAAETLPGNTTGPVAGDAEASPEENKADYYRNLDVSQLDAEHLSTLGEFFKDSVIIGDSVAENFQRYNLTTGIGDAVSDNFTSLAVAGYSIKKALLPNNGSNIHPMIQGKRYRLPEAVNMIGAKHVYSFFGYKDLNDVAAADNYEKLLQEIQAANPETDITVISTTYMTKNFQNSEYNNEKVRTLNEAMKLKCAANGWGFIDVQDIMSDGAGNLPEEWSIDKQIHYNYQYYIYWVNEMKRYALEKLGI
ncbi:hypothetical protein UYO_2461 [Lachnospiraceae bacterium JC7]|nr:hypothetical protein UYO_2461 [Lachnospiraceae bacterium JC7]